MTYDPVLYAALHRGNPGDLTFYRNACQGAGSVLELGCGYGRVLAALVDVVPERWGLDADAGLLALADAAVDATLAQASMQSFELGRRFDRILIPYNGLYCLLTDDEVAACLTAARRHLAPDGRLIVDVYPYEGAPDLEVFDEASEPVPIVHLEEEGRRYVVYESACLVAGTEVVEVTYHYEPEDGAEAVVGRIRQRAMTMSKLAEHIAQAGLRVVSWQGGFLGEALNEAAQQWVLIAEAGPSSATGP